MEQIPVPPGTTTSSVSPEQLRDAVTAAVAKLERSSSALIDESPLLGITEFLQEYLGAYNIRVTEWQRLWLNRWFAQATATAEASTLRPTPSCTPPRTTARERPSTSPTTPATGV